jgi:hypothetical protein
MRYGALPVRRPVVCELPDSISSDRGENLALVRPWKAALMGAAELALAKIQRLVAYEDAEPVLASIQRLVAYEAAGPVAAEVLLAGRDSSSGRRLLRERRGLLGLHSE